jgi:PAS domain S-box-containing protein
LRTSQEYAKNVIGSSLDMIITVDTDRHIIEFNKAAEENFGYRHEEVVGTSIETLYANPQEALAIHKATIEQGKCVQEILNRRKNGEVFPSFLSASLLRDGAGEVVGAMGVSRDITASKQAEEKIRASLNEKEVLLREVHHRVKNNLQVISSLLDMRAMRTDNHQVIDMFEDTRSKIHTMALIHTRLYRSERFDRIDMGSHIRELVEYLSRIYITKSVSISTVIEAQDVYLSVTQAIPCALVLNELISNAFKHAFEEGQKGAIEISLEMEDHNKVFLEVKDNGRGLAEEIDILKTNSLGFKLLRNTVQGQLMGKIHIEQGVGTTIIVEFEISE